jgi:hypothetical protein
MIDRVKISDLFEIGRDAIQTGEFSNAGPDVIIFIIQKIAAELGYKLVPINDSFAAGTED